MYNFKITPIWKIQVKDGKYTFSPEEESRLHKWLLSHEGDYEFVIRKKFNKRSLPQNAYFHGVVLPMIADAMGEENLAEVKAILKTKFLSKEKVLAGKENQFETVQIVGRTSKLKTDTFGFFVEKCRMWASKFLGVNIPDPDPEYNQHPVFLGELED